MSKSFTETVVVPVLPTREMLDAGVAAMCVRSDKFDYIVVGTLQDALAAAFSAMLKAAPK